MANPPYSTMSPSDQLSGKVKQIRGRMSPGSNGGASTGSKPTLRTGGTVGQPTGINPMAPRSSGPGNTGSNLTASSPVQQAAVGALRGQPGGASSGANNTAAPNFLAALGAAGAHPMPAPMAMAPGGGQMGPGGMQNGQVDPNSPGQFHGSMTPIGQAPPGAPPPPGAMGMAQGGFNPQAMQAQQAMQAMRPPQMMGAGGGGQMPMQSIGSMQLPAGINHPPGQTLPFQPPQTMGMGGGVGQVQGQAQGMLGGLLGGQYRPPATMQGGSPQQAAGFHPMLGMNGGSGGAGTA